MKWRSLLLASLTTVGALAADATTAEIAAMKIAEGYDVSLFASEADGVVKPIQIRFDPQGRLWVIGSTVYPQLEPGREPNDKVVVLEDTNNDGRADKSTVFADGLMIPTGLELGDGGVYIGQTTTLLHLKDTDGDGKADERRVVLRGFGTGDSHQTINSFTWSPGGEMFMCQGLHALSRVETPWGIERLHSAGVWRFHPRLLKLDPFLNEEMGPQNPFGFAFDRWGQIILAAGNGQGIYDLTPAMIRAPKHRTLPNLWNAGRKFAGGDFVENSHFPPEAQGEFITGSYLNNAVYRFRITEEGSSYRVQDLPPLIASTNTSFRIVDVRFGPDGALYLCDWFNPVIGHYQASFRHPDRDKTRGRIWRVTAKGRPLVEKPNLARASVEQLLEQLKSSERWNRQLAKRALADRSSAEVTNQVSAWIGKQSKNGGAYEHLLFEAVGVLESHESPAPQLVTTLAGAKDHHARAYAARVAGRWGSRVPTLLSTLETLVQDVHPRVRLEAVVAASYFPDARAVSIALRAADRPMDRFLEYALAQTIHTLKPHWNGPLQSGALTLATKTHLERLVKEDASADTLGFVRRELNKESLDRETKESFLRIMAEVGTPSDIRTLLDPARFKFGSASDPQMHARVLTALAENSRVRKVRAEEPFADLLAALAKSSDATVRAAAFAVIASWNQRSLAPTVELAANDLSRDVSERVAAIRALGDFEPPFSNALAALATKKSPVQIAAISALARSSPEGAAQIATALFAEADADIETLLTGFLQVRNGSAALAKVLQAFAVTQPNAVRALQVMAATGRRDEALAEMFSKAAGRSNNSLPKTAPEIATLAAEVKRSGDTRRGREIYLRPELGCAACHAINNEGGQVGPDLGALGSAQAIDFIIGAILQPNKEVKEGFTAAEFITKSNDEIQGYILREDAQEVTVRDTLQHREIRFRRDQIKERRLIGSLMPEGLCDSLSRTEFRDLVAYLASLGKP